MVRFSWKRFHKRGEGHYNYFYSAFSFYARKSLTMFTQGVVGRVCWHTTTSTILTGVRFDERKGNKYYSSFFGARIDLWQISFLFILWIVIYYCVQHNTTTTTIFNKGCLSYKKVISASSLFITDSSHDLIAKICMNEYPSIGMNDMRTNSYVCPFIGSCLCTLALLYTTNTHCMNENESPYEYTIRVIRSRSVHSDTFSYIRLGKGIV